MSCGISLMYKLSGGTDKKMRKCESCRYLMEDEESAGFGAKGSRTSYRCSKHPDKKEPHIWSPAYPACKKYRERKPEPDPALYTLGDNGQYVLVLT